MDVKAAVATAAAASPPAMTDRRLGPNFLDNAIKPFSIQRDVAASVCPMTSR
jgi:hypothetical protein